MQHKAFILQFISCTFSYVRCELAVWAQFYAMLVHLPQVMQPCPEVLATCVDQNGAVLQCGDLAKLSTDAPYIKKQCARCLFRRMFQRPSECWFQLELSFCHVTPAHHGMRCSSWLSCIFAVSTQSKACIGSSGITGITCAEETERLQGKMHQLLGIFSVDEARCWGRIRPGDACCRGPAVGEAHCCNHILSVAQPCRNLQ